MEHPISSTTDNILRLCYRSGLREAPEEADRLLAQLKEWFHSSQRSDLRPTNFTYAIVVAIWTASLKTDPDAATEAARRAESILDEFKAANRSPNLVLYGAIIDAISKAGRAERAHELWVQLILMQIEQMERRKTPVSRDALLDSFTLGEDPENMRRHGLMSLPLCSG